MTTGLIGFLFVWLVPIGERTAWHDAPLIAIVSCCGPRWAGDLLSTIVVIGSTAFLALVIYRSATNTQKLLLRLSEDGVLLPATRAPHPQLGTPARLIDLAALAAVAVLIAGAGQISWFASAYAVAVVVGVVLKVAALIRFRRLRPETRAYRVPLNFRLFGREWPVGLAFVALMAAVPIVMLVVRGNAAAFGGVALIVGVAALLQTSERAGVWAGAQAANAWNPALAGLSRDPALAGLSTHGIELLSVPAVGVDSVDVRAGSVLVPVRNPGLLNHLVAALQSASDRDVVVMTVRLVGSDVSDDLALKNEPTESERGVLTAAAMLAERYGRAIRLLIVPATNVFDAVAETVVRLRSTDVYVGESRTLSADEQARRLGEAWEQVAHRERFDVRLVVHHNSGRTAVYHLGAHAPALSPDDLHLIHTLWLDAVKAIGPHIHHRDIVRAALTHMQEQLNDDGPSRDAALDLVRRTAHPAEELAELVHQRDFARLRDMVRNRPASDLAEMLTDLSLEDQVVTFRVLPRKIAAATFEYLSQ